MGLKNTGGEIVEVQGGHIVRSTGRKDRHSKVCTAKGPRDRRVRLSAHTAIQFYDVQDRLGYDRPSKAVDWLIKNAKSAIDELAELPPWHPTASPQPEQAQEDETPHGFNHGEQEPVLGSSKRPMEAEPEPSGYPFLHQQNPSFLPPSLDSDAIADTIKSFFPVTSSSSMHFQNYPPDLLSRSSGQTQDLRLSLHSFQDPILLHHHQSQHHSNPTPSAEQQTLFSASNPIGFDSSSANWSEQQHPSDISRFQRMVSWNSGEDTGNGGGGGGGYVFNSPPLLQLQPLLCQNQMFSQRGPLQSSNSSSVRAWMNQNQSNANTDHHHHHHHQQRLALHPSSISGFASGGFSGFHIPARIQGEEEHDDAVSDKPSSASSASRH